MRWPTPSVAASLTVGIGLVSLAVFAAAGLLIQRALERDLIEADRATLRGKISVVLHFADEAARSGDRPAFLHHLDDLRIGHHGLHVWISEADGKLVYGTGTVTTVDPGRGLLSPSQVVVDYAQAELPETSPWPRGLLRIAAEVTPRTNLLERNARTLLAACAFGVAAIVAISWLAIRRSLQPVTQLSNEASAITPRSLGTRLTIPPGTAEVAGLVRSFNGLLDRLEEAYAQLQSFNANVAHELRTPLASLITGSQIALSSARSRDDLREVLSSNLEELQLLSALVSDMLFLSRADTGDRAEGLETMQLGSEADKALRYCEALMHDHGVRGERVGDAAALCNPALVRRAIVNLLTNAIRHTAAPGCVRIALDKAEGRARVSVENPGSPIAPDVQARMFDRFYRSDVLHSGHGLGLAIVAAIAHMHGGTVFVDRSGGSNRIGFTLQQPDEPKDNGLERQRSRDHLTNL